jgi:hypothetical protein
MIFNAQVVGVASISKKLKNYDESHIEYTIKSYENDCTLKLKFPIDEVPDLELGDEVKLNVDVNVQARQIDMSNLIGSVSERELNGTAAG